MENESEQARIGQSLSVSKVKIYFTCFFSLRAGGTQTISVDKKGMIGDMSNNKKTLPCSKAMRKTRFSGFLCFAKDETDLFSYSNLNPKINSGSVLAKVLQNKCGSKYETRIHENDLKILKVRNHCTEIIKYFEYFRK